MPAEPPAEPIAPTPARAPDEQRTRASRHAAQGAMIRPVSDAAPRGDTDMAAQGRRTVSTAFVRLGPGGHLLLTLRDGSEVALRDVTMEKRAVCGVALAGGRDERQCRGYAQVIAARAVDAAVGVAPVPPG